MEIGDLVRYNRLSHKKRRSICCDRTSKIPKQTPSSRKSHEHNKTQWYEAVDLYQVFGGDRRLN